MQKEKNKTDQLINKIPMPFVQIKEEETETCSYSFCKYVIVSTYRLGAFRMDSTTMTPAPFFFFVVFVVCVCFLCPGSSLFRWG